MDGILPLLGSFIDTVGFPVVIALGALWIVHKEIPKISLSVKEATEMSLDAHRQMSTNFTASVEKLFALHTSAVADVAETMKDVVSESGRAHSESIKSRDARLSTLVDRIFSKEGR